MTRLVSPARDRAPPTLSQHEGASPPGHIYRDSTLVRQISFCSFITMFTVLLLFPLFFLSSDAGRCGEQRVCVCSSSLTVISCTGLGLARLPRLNNAEKTSVQVLVLQGNSIAVVHAQTLSDMPSLTTLDVRGQRHGACVRVEGAVRPNLSVLGECKPTTTDETPTTATTLNDTDDWVRPTPNPHDLETTWMPTQTRTTVHQTTYEKETTQASTETTTPVHPTTSEKAVTVSPTTADPLTTSEKAITATVTTAAAAADRGRLSPAVIGGIFAASFLVIIAIVAAVLVCCFCPGRVRRRAQGCKDKDSDDSNPDDASSM